MDTRQAPPRERQPPPLAPLSLVYRPETENPILVASCVPQEGLVDLALSWEYLTDPRLRQDASPHLRAACVQALQDKSLALTRTFWSCARRRHVHMLDMPQVRFEGYLLWEQPLQDPSRILSLRLQGPPAGK